MATMPANCLHQSPTSLRIKILSKRRRKRSALPFVPCNVAFKLQGEADVVKPFKKQLFAELVYLKVHLPAASNYKLSCKVDLDFKVVVFEQIVDFFGLQSYWQYAVLEAVVVENICKGRRYHCPEPIIEYGPGRVFPRASASKVIPRKQHLPPGVFRVVKHKVISWLAFPVKAPVIKEVLAKAGPADKL